MTEQYPVKHRLYDTNTIFRLENETGTQNYKFQLMSGARLVFTLQIISIDPTATVTITFKNGHTIHLPLQTIGTITKTVTGFTNRVFSDVHNLFDIQLTVSGGNATLGVGMSVRDDDQAVTVAATTEEEELLQRLMCSPDKRRDYTFQEIDGVQRVTQIVFTSAFLDADTGQTISLTRVFTYKGSDPFTLERIQDTLLVT